jgi:uncharacterized protein (TIGR03435 family)
MRMPGCSKQLSCIGAVCAFACLLASCAAASSQQSTADPAVQGEAPSLIAVDQVMMFPDTGDDTGRGFLWWGAHNGWMFSNVSTLKLIANAYGLGMHQVIGLPSWAETDRYGLVANMAADKFEAFEKLTTDEQVRQQRLMTQVVLAERYQLKAHRETREVPVYELVVANQGLKIAERERLGSLYSGSSFFVPRDWHSYGTMEDLASKLAGPTGGIVVDKTGLGTKRFHYELKWTSDAQSGTARGGPSIFTALEEQLGLKLVPATDSVEVLVIDRIEKPTTGMQRKTSSGSSL